MASSFVSPLCVFRLMMLVVTSMIWMDGWMDESLQWYWHSIWYVIDCHTTRQLNKSIGQSVRLSNTPSIYFFHSFIHSFTSPSILVFNQQSHRSILSTFLPISFPLPILFLLCFVFVCAHQLRSRDPFFMGRRLPFASAYMILTWVMRGSEIGFTCDWIAIKPYDHPFVTAHT